MSDMVCMYCCTATVTWRGPWSNLTHTECSKCGSRNCQIIEPECDDDESEPQPHD
jgi:hypothetical protein